jgi:hypothetical protein
MNIANFIIALIAFGLSSWMFIKDYLLSAKVKLYTGDSFQIVSGSRNKIQLNLNFTNPRNKLSVINHLEADLKSPNGNIYHYTWNVFYKIDYVNSAITAIPTQFPSSLSVLAKSSVFQGVEFISDDHFSWTEGVYEFKIIGCYNREPSDKMNLSKSITFSLNKNDVDNLSNGQLVNNMSISRPVKILNGN